VCAYLQNKLLCFECLSLVTHRSICIVHDAFMCGVVGYVDPFKHADDIYSMNALSYLIVLSFCLVLSNEELGHGQDG